MNDQQDLFTAGAKSKNVHMRWSAAFWIPKLPDAQRERLATVIEDLRGDPVEMVRKEANEEG